VSAYFLVMGLTGGVWMARIPAAKAQAHLSDGILGVALFAAPVGLVLGICGLVGEGAAGDWSAVYLRDNLGASAGFGGPGRRRRGREPGRPAPGAAHPPRPGRLDRGRGPCAAHARRKQAKATARTRPG
jgi:hypothetical protein